MVVIHNDIQSTVQCTENIRTGAFVLEMMLEHRPELGLFGLLVNIKGNITSPQWIKEPLSEERQVSKV